MIISLIAAVDEKGGIAKNNKIPWLSKYPEDMKWFKTITMFKIVVITRTTWESMNKRNLPGRFLLITSSTEEKAKAVDINKKAGLSITLSQLDNLVDGIYDINKLWCDIHLPSTTEEINAAEEYLNGFQRDLIIAGGPFLYERLLTPYTCLFTLKEIRYVSNIYLTKIPGNYDCDSFFPLGLVDLKHYRVVNSIKSELNELCLDFYMKSFY